MIEEGEVRTRVALYRCGCADCDAAEEQLRALTQRYGADLEVDRVDRDARLRGFAGWDTPIVSIDGTAITHYVMDKKAWERALRDKTAARPTTVAGLVVDMCCYFRRGVRPAGHESCARECFESGGPAAVVSGDGRVFLALPDRSAPEAFASLKERPGREVRVTGEVRLREGHYGIVVSRVESG